MDISATSRTNDPGPVENKAMSAADLVSPDPMVRILELASRYRRGDLGPDGFAKEVCRVLDQG